MRGSGVNRFPSAFLELQLLEKSCAKSEKRFTVMFARWFSDEDLQVRMHCDWQRTSVDGAGRRHRGECMSAIGPARSLPKGIGVYGYLFDSAQFAQAATK